MTLTCSLMERPDIQCCIVENGVRCDHGIRNKKRMLCSKHYARWQRKGTVDLSLPNGGSLSKARRLEAMYNRQKRLTDEGMSTMCLCAHNFLRHSVRNGCKEFECECNAFEGTNVIMFYDILHRMNILGFSEPINDLAKCEHCIKFVRVGKWHDQMTISRMKEHLRLFHLQKRKLRAV